MNFLELIRHKYFKFAVAGTLYLLWVIWVGTYWLLPGLLIVFDIYVTKRVNWAFWKKREGMNNTFIEWLDALIFAVIAVTFINIFFFQNFKIPTGSMEKSLLIGDHLFVSKLTYGPKTPNTPLSFPFTQNTMPIIKGKSFLTWIQWPYHRMKGFKKIKNDDVVVFNFPAGDTVVVEQSAQSYYSIARGFAEEYRMQDNLSGVSERPYSYYYNLGRRYVLDNYEIVVRPIDRRDNYIKRCIGIPGDSIKIIHGRVYVNGNAQPDVDGLQYKYRIKTNGTPINPRALERMGIARDDIRLDLSNNDYVMPLTSENVVKIEAFSNVTVAERTEVTEGEYAYYIFPHDTTYAWNEDNFGPLEIPYKGLVVELTMKNISIYKRIIEAFEGNELNIRNGKIYINGVETTTYTIQMDYYFMMGDNRHDSADSRFWGFVPENHIVGSPKFIWLSLNKDKSFPKSIRFNRMFTRIR